MCNKDGWEPFHVKEKERNEPYHRCYLRCTHDECADIKVRAFNEDDIDIEFIGEGFNDPYIIDLGDDDN